VDRSGGCDRALARGDGVSSMGDNSDIDCAGCVEPTDKNATATSNAAWQTYSSLSTKRNSTKRRDSKLSPRYSPDPAIPSGIPQAPHQSANLSSNYDTQRRSYMHFPSTLHHPHPSVLWACVMLNVCAWRARQSPVHHSPIREVRDGVNALPSNIRRGLVREQEEQ